VTANLFATVSGQPTIGRYPNSDLTATWSWSVVDVEFSSDGGNDPTSVWPGGCSLSINQSLPSTPDAILTASFPTGGIWTITVSATVTFTDGSGNTVASASGNVTLADISVQWPGLSLSSAKSAICAGGIQTDPHQTSVTATVLDSQGNPQPGVLVIFDTSEGALSASSATTGSDGTATVVLTSDTNASGPYNQVFAQVTAYLDSQPDVTMSVSVEFLQPDYAFDIQTSPLEEGELASMVLTATFGGQPVSGHQISFTLTAAWDQYGNSVTDPTTFAQILNSQGTSQSSGVASGPIQIGNQQGIIQVMAADENVVTTPPPPNPGATPGPATPVEHKVMKPIAGGVEIAQIEFTSIHRLMWKPKAVTGPPAYQILAGDKEPTPEWVPSTGANAVMSHTAGVNGKTIKIEITVTLNVDNSVPANSNFVLKGTSGETALNFTKAGTISPGNGIKITMTADNAIGQTIRKINDSIDWQITIGAKPAIKLGASGPHVIYTTLGVPKVTTDGSKPTSVRMDKAVFVMNQAVTAAGTFDNEPKIVQQMNVNLGAFFYLFRSLAGTKKFTQDAQTEAWLFFDVSTNDLAKQYDGDAVFNDPVQRPAIGGNKFGTDCISTVTFEMNVCAAMGMSSTLSTQTYIAYYATAADANRPTKAVIGNFQNTANGGFTIHPGDVGNPATAGLDATNDFTLFTDSTCTHPTNAWNATTNPGGVKPGQVGCGPLGFNNFEAAMLVKVSGNNTWYFPGGVKAVFQDVNKVVQVFQTLAWVEITIDAGQSKKFVKKVDFTYTPQPSDTP
jgi:hypothetical protein